MATFTLTVVDETHQILSTEEALRPDHVKRIHHAFDAWRANGGALIVGDCVVVGGRSIEIDLDVASSAAEIRHERLLLGGEVGNVPPPDPPPDRG